MSIRLAALIVIASVAAPSLAAAQTPASPAPKRIQATYSCSDKKTRITYDEPKNRAYLTYAAKRIVLTRVAPGTEHYVSAKYNLDWNATGEKAVLSSTDPKTGAPVSTLADCTAIAKK